MANPILHTHHAMWASVGLLAGCGLTLFITAVFDEDRACGETAPPVAHVSSAPSMPDVAPARVVSHGVACPEQGMIKGRSTSGQCCWYGQRWSGKQARCIGTPFRCPEGKVALGETCAVLQPSLSIAEVESSMSAARTRLLACDRGDYEPIWIDFSISPRGQAFAISASKGQPELRTESGADSLRCVQDILIQIEFPAGHRTTRMHHVIINEHITPEIY